MRKPIKAERADAAVSSFDPSESVSFGGGTEVGNAPNGHAGQESVKRRLDLTFEIEGCPLHIREAFELWRLGIVRRVHQEQIRESKGYNAGHAAKVEALRNEWRNFTRCYQAAVWGVRP
jgi:hypothetical protein